MSNWTLECLANLCTTLTDGNWIESKDQSPQGIRLIQTGNVGEGRFKDRCNKARFISNETFSRLNCTEIFSGDCLISRLPDPVGRACLLPDVGQRMITAVDCSIVRFNRLKILPEFFVYFSQAPSYRKQIVDLTTGTTRDRISRSNLGKILVPLPPLAEQQRIVTILDEAFEGIEAAASLVKKNLSNAGALFEQIADASMEAKSDWQTSSLGDLGRLTTGNTPKSSSEGNYGGEIPFVKPGDFRPDGTLNYDNEGLTEAGMRQSRLMNAGAALMVCIGATIGKSGFAERDICANQQVNAFSAGPHVNGRFIFQQMRASRFQSEVKRNAGQATLPIISKSKWGGLQIYYPGLDEQARIVKFLDQQRVQLDCLAAIYNRKLALLSELKKSLLARAFLGQIRAPATPVATGNAFATPEQAAYILAFMHCRHEHANRGRFFGRVMGQKTLDLVERVGRLDLGRTPYKDAAGPNDRSHMVAAERWAKQQGFFDFVERSGGGYDFRKLSNHSVMLEVARAALKHVEVQLAQVADILVGKDTLEAEVFATALAAWNNLVADGKEASNMAIIREAREGWHLDKLAIPISKFHSAIQEIRRRNLVPDGTAKVVRHRQASLL